MKKKIALLLFLALALTTIFTACNSPDATKIIPRWSTDGESYVYNVTLADFAESGSTYFNWYDHDGAKYYKDFVIRVGEPLESMDEVRPISVTGTYTLTITHLAEDKYDRVETVQDINVSYALEGGKIKLGNNLFAELTAELNALVVANDGNRVTLKSTTETMVEFNRNDDGKQAPRKSRTEVNGFYIGKVHQEASHYEMTTTYTYESKSTTVESELKRWTGDEVKTEKITNTLKRYTTGKFIDSNQLFMYTRSFDKTASSFQDNPTVAVYNPLTQEMQTASFAFTSAQNARLTNDNAELYAKLPTVGVVVGGMPFMLQESAPNMLDENNKGADRAEYGTEWYAKHTPVRFRVGYISFELQYEDELWNALSDYANKKD